MSNQFKILDAYAPLFYSDKTYFVVSGGRSSGKSVNCAAYLLTKLIGDEPNRIVISRYTAKSLTNSLYQDILDLINMWGIGPMLQISQDQILNKANGNILFTHAVKISDGTQVAKSKGISACNILFVDEAIEMPNLQSFQRLSDSFRMKDREIKIILAFNPSHKGHWIHQHFFNPDSTPKESRMHNTCFIHTTYNDNIENINPAKIKEWELSQYSDPDYFRYEILGHWRATGQGSVFKNWKWSEYNPDPEAEIVYGMDFGFASDPTTLIKVHKKDKRLWIEELIYDRGLTTEDLSARLEALGLSKNISIYADSADPRSIETLKRLGWRNIRSAHKGPDSIRAGIDKIHTFEVFANSGSKNLAEEYQMYAFREGTDKPIDSYNHLMDSLRYAVGSLHEGPRYAVIGRSRSIGEPI